jgi:hypothetical protein
MIESLRLKAYLNAPELFPLSQDQQDQFELDLVPFITAPQEEDAWKTIGLQDASFREKAERLLEHIQSFRNWIVPYPLDGLHALLQEGMANGRDAYEKNWCALQLTLLLLQEHRNAVQANAILQQLQVGENGTIVLLPQDADLLRQTNGWMQRVSLADE